MPDIFQGDFSGVDININNTTLQNQTGDIVLEATNDINVNAEITTNGNDITLTADADNDEAGRLFVDAEINSGGGVISLTGNNIFSQGILIQDGELNSQGGDINIIGRLSTGGQINSTGGDISFTGTDINIGATINSGTGNITLETDELTTFASPGLTGSGNLTIQPLSLERNLQISDDSLSGFLVIGASFLVNNVDDGFTSITIGRTDGSGSITIVNDAVFNDSVTLVTGGNISINASFTTNGEDITLTVPTGSIFVDDDISSGSGNIVLTANSISSQDGAINSSTGNISLNGGSINIGVPINSSGGNITLVGTSINFGNTISSETGNIILEANQITGFESPNLESSGGTLLIQPSTAELALEIGGNFVEQSVVENADGFVSITIGRENSSGAITLSEDITFNDPVTIQSPAGTGTINTTGFTITGADNATITLQANQNITTGDITNPGRNITLESTSGNLSVGTLTTDDLNAGSINLTASGDINTSRLSSETTGAGIGGNIAVTSINGSINASNGVGDIDSGSPDAGLGSGGNITLTAQGNIVTGDVLSRSNTNGTGGNISITSNTGSINTDTTATEFGVQAFGASGGTITMNAQGDITTRSVLTRAITNNAGNVTLNSNTGSVTVNTELDARSLGTGNGGTIAITANEINFTGNVSSNGGSLTLQPAISSQAIAIGGTNNDNTNTTLELISTELGFVQDGFTSINIGRSDGTGAINLSAITATTFNDPVNIAGGSTLVGLNVNTTWNISGINQGNLNSIFPNGFTFNNIENLTGGSSNDTFQFSDGANVSGAITDIGGTAETLDYSASTTPLTINLQTLQATGIEQIIGTTNASSVLIGKNETSTWTISGSNEGTVSAISFTNFQSLIGGTADDTFVFNNGIDFSGTIDGSSGTDTLNYSAYTTSLTVNLSELQATSIENIVGTTQAESTLIGTNTSNTWTITGNNSGDINNNLNFSNFNNLAGGTANDTFAFNDSINFNGNINGNSGTDTLNYSNYTSSLEVNLQTLQATGIEQIIGTTNASSTLIGRDETNTWTITGSNQGTVSTIGFTNFQNLTGEI